MNTIILFFFLLINRINKIVNQILQKKRSEKKLKIAIESEKKKKEKD